MVDQNSYKEIEEKLQEIIEILEERLDKIEKELKDLSENIKKTIIYLIQIIKNFLYS